MSYRHNKYLGWILSAITGVLVILFFVGAFYLPGEYQIGTEVVVSRTPESIWKWFAHPDNWKKRFSVIHSVEEPLNNKGAGVGEQLTIETNIPGGMKLKSNIVITDWVKGRLVGDWHQGDWINGRSLPLTKVIDRFEFKPEGLGKTRIIFKETFDVNGPFNKWLAYLVVKPAEDRLLAEILNEYNHSIKQNHSTPASRDKSGEPSNWRITDVKESFIYQDLSFRSNH
ncbi:MAG: SRPBCC family protein [Nitrospiria bacterium]